MLTQTYYQDVAFTRSGDTMYRTQVAGAARRIVVSRLHDGRWSAPVTVSFSGVWRDLEEALSPDDRTMIFASNRPVAPGGRPLDAFFGNKFRPGRGGNLWRSTWDGTSWTQPLRLPDAVNANTSTFAPALAGDGTLVFMRASGPGQHFHLFISTPAHGVYASSAMASFSDLRYSDFDPTIASDGSFVVFCSNRPPSKPGTADVFITYRSADGWTAPRDMGDWINPNRDTIEPRLSPDNRTLYFTSSTAPESMRHADITHWVPLRSPKQFAASVLHDADSTPTFSRDGATMIYAASGAKHDAIAVSHFDGVQWTAPVVAPFSGVWNDIDPVFSPDGSYAIFSSQRPIDGSPSAKPQLWRVSFARGRWGEPVPLPATVNDGAFLVAPSIANDGTLYYLHIANHMHRIYCARMQNGAYAAPRPVMLGDNDAQDYDPWIAPDQSYLLFASSGRGAADTKRHLYGVARHGASWGAVFPIRYQGESSSDDSGPVVSPNGKVLYFISDRSIQSPIWALDLSRMPL